MTAAMVNRTASPSSMPTSGAGRHTGSERNRSKTPLPISVRRVCPVYIVIMISDCTRMPGSRNCTYPPVDPASAPPKR